MFNIKKLGLALVLVVAGVLGGQVSLVQLGTGMLGTVRVEGHTDAALP